MKQFRCALVILLIFTCSLSLFGCTGKDDLVGVYQRESAGNPNSATNRIILYKDGTCSYLGTDNATWSYKGDVVTVTTREPDSYYLDVYFDKSLSEIAFHYAGTNIKHILSSCSVDFIGEPECNLESYVVRVKTEDLVDGKQNKRVYDALLAMEGLQKIDSYLKEGNHWDYELKVVDNCLVADSYPVDSVYVKVGN